ncbi:MAG TPA: choice-of-anchor H family protein [Gammaproteobacteria bacterium]|nr:choice-of-anchor H family protein [Gammaproteobacteria bacterium]
MNTNDKSARARYTALLASAALALAIPIAGPAHADEAAPKTVRSSGGRVSERGDARSRDRSTFVESETFATERARGPGKGDSTTAAAVIEEAWVYDADVELFDDYDGDGFFTFLRVTFDADSIYPSHWIYARLFVTLDGVTWDEYHITDDILIEGTSPLDDYEVETELLSGFEPGHYDVLIEIYNADFGHFLGEFGPVQSSAFSLLPLEDVDRDTVQPVVVVTSEHGGGGAAGLPALAGLLLLAGLARRLRRRAQRPVG